MSRKVRVGILFGGKSAEHEVSLQSAKNVLDALDRSKYEAVLIGIDKRGKWHLNQASQFLLDAHDPRRIRLDSEPNTVTLVPWQNERQLVGFGETPALQPLDVVFPVLHGPLGEDGTVQGLLKLAGIPFVGSGVLASAAGMDKDVSKRLLRDAGLPIARFQVWHCWQPAPDFERLTDWLGSPLFVKPANLGSSVGVHRVGSPRELRNALKDACSYDQKIIIEESVSGREIECSVLGNREPEASVPGEVVPRHDFYSYEAKYIDDNGADLIVPADLPDELTRRVQELAIRSFQVLGCEGMARVDFFLSGEHLVINELNTIPGFTKISMYPRLWEASGVPYSELVDRLIELALERHRREEKLESSYRPSPGP